MMRLLLFFLLSFLSWNLLASPVKNEGRGKVSVNGQILLSACSIHVDDRWQEIIFDPHSHTDIIDGTSKSVKNFSVRLVSCHVNSGGGINSILLTFDGEAVSDQLSLFSVNGDAEGIALKVTGHDGEQAIPGVTMQSIPLQQDSHSLEYGLQIVPDGSGFKEGSWSGVLRLIMSYQ
ncbi:fimbrial protein [Citrobacter farmeri]|uniref:fimbrial protein n=1 Tax=Citrobacter farmeri TaxID=67824 RepID=UPI00292CB99A|nr:fimbrial protein [Citrobacter farmeri]